MKMRASLLEFVIALVAVVSVAAAGLILGHRNLTRRANTELQTQYSREASRQAGARYAQLPLSFEANMGQAAPEVQFLSHGDGYQLFLTRQEAVLALRHGAAHVSRTTPVSRTKQSKPMVKSSVLRLEFANSNPKAAVEGVDRLPGRTDYFIGQDPRDWRTGIPSYARVAYRDMYPGVDAVFYGNQRQIEYDFVVSPGTNPTQIAFGVRGADSLAVNSNGNLAMDVAGDKVTLLKPLAYQIVAGEKREVGVNYSVKGGEVKFSVGDYDSSRELVIDPVLDYSTYLGGSATSASGNGLESGFGIAVDSKGDAYVTGQTFSTKFPTTASNAYTPTVTSNPNGAVFVTELNPTGTAQLYSTYLIATDAQGDFGNALALDASGNIYITGQTLSQQFPVTASAAQSAPVSGSTNGSAFICKINPSLSGTNSLVYSSYLGGSGGDAGAAIAADASNNAYVVGVTFSSDFLQTVTSATGYQTSNPENATAASGAGSGFLAVVNTAGTGATSVTYSTYLGGSGHFASNAQYGDEALGVAVDSTRNAYIVGTTSSIDFPMLNGSQTSFNASNQTAEAFLSVINTAKTLSSSLVYSSYLGGDVFDVATAVSLEPGNASPANAVYVTGQTASQQFPTSTGAYASTVSNLGVAFVTVFDTTQSGNAGLKYSAVVGGSSGDEGNGIQVDSSGNAYVVGTTASSDFPTTAGAFQNGNNNAGGTALVFELNPGGNGTADLVYSTFFGGSGTNGGDTGAAIALGPSNNAYITGSTGSTSNFPLSTAPFQSAITKFDGTATVAAYVAELTLQPTLSITPTTTLAFGNVSEGTLATACGALSPCTVTLTNNTGSAIPLTIGAITPGPSDFVAVTTCGANLNSGAVCTITVTFSPSSLTSETAMLPVSFTAGNNTTPSVVNITLTGTGTDFTLTPLALTFPTQLVTSTSSIQTVAMKNTTASALTFTTAATAGFAESDNCSGSVAASGSCTLNVTFAPTAAGPVTGTLTVTVNGQNQTVQLTGSGGDFSVTMPASISVTNNAGSGSANLTATPSGFAPSVSFTCSTTIPNGSCTAPTTTAPNSFAISVSVSAFVPPTSQRFDGWRMLRPVVPIAAMMLALLAFPALRRRRAWLGFAAVVIVFTVLAGCSSSNSSSPKTYSLSLTGSTTSGSTTVTHNFTTSVTVQ